MREKIPSASNVFKIALFILFFVLPMGLGMVLGYQSAGGYVSPLLLLLLTWWLYRKEGRSLGELGLPLHKRNLLFLPLGIAFGIMFLSVTLFLQMLQDDFHIRFNPNVSTAAVLAGPFYLLQGVLNEELIFRGYFFKKAAAQKGLMVANLLFASLFIVWHWISWDAWGDPGKMFSAITTGFGHFLFSTALVSSSTLYFPIGLHLGINWASRYLFSIGGQAENHMGRNDVLFIVDGAAIQASTLQTVSNYTITISCFLILTGLIWKYRKGIRP